MSVFFRLLFGGCLCHSLFAVIALYGRACVRVSHTLECHVLLDELSHLRMGMIAR